MAITGPASYIPTTEEFLAHWEQANEASSPTAPLTLPGSIIKSPTPIAYATLNQLFAELQSRHVGIQAKINMVDILRGDLEALKGTMLARLNAFNLLVQSVLPGTGYVRALPLVPGIGVGQENFTRPMDDVSALWNEINGATLPGVDLPLSLPDGTLVAMFDTDNAALKALYREIVKAEKKLELERELRNDQQEVIYAILKQYRVSVPGKLGVNSPLVATLPRLTPEPGSTPEAPVATGTWDAGQVKGKVTATVPEPGNLKRVELRYSPGTVYHTDDESVVASVPPGEAVEFLTEFALGQPGAFALFRVVAIAHTDNEAGSNAVRIDRPA